MNYIILGISILSLVISLSTTIRYLYMERFNIQVDFIKWFGANETGDFPFFLWLSIANKSKIPCSIISIDLEVKKSRNGMLKAIGIGDGLSKTVYGSNDEKITSLNYPINIDGYSAISGYFHFKSEHPFYHFEECEVELTIKTTRSNLKKRIKLDFDNNVFRALQGQDVTIQNSANKDSFKNCLSKYYID